MMDGVLSVSLLTHVVDWMLLTQSVQLEDTVMMFMLLIDTLYLLLLGFVGEVYLL